MDAAHFFKQDELFLASTDSTYTSLKRTKKRTNEQTDFLSLVGVKIYIYIHRKFLFWHTPHCLNKKIT